MNDECHECYRENGEHESDCSLASQAKSSPAGSLALPELNDDIKEILGSMPWRSAPIARRLHDLKIYEVKRKCEEEQAAAMHWMLNLYLAHGKEWRTVGEKILKAEASENAELSGGTKKTP